MENSERDGNTRPPDLLLRNLYAGQEATVRTAHGKTDWLQIRKGVCQSCILSYLTYMQEKAMGTHSSTLAWKISWTEEPGRLQSMGSRRVGRDWATSLSLFTFMHWKVKWQPAPVFLPGAVCVVAQSRTRLKRLGGGSRRNRGAYARTRAKGKLV